jgi:uncharacterized membrane protein
MKKKRSQKTVDSRSNGNAPENGDSVTKANITKIAKIEEEAHANSSVSEIIAGAIADFCGSMTFVWVHVAWFSTWILLNTVLGISFDPFPFTFLTLVVSLEAIFLSTFILINQNRENAISERRNHLDLQVNLLAEQENTKMLYFLERIADKVGAEVVDKDLTDELSSETDPEQLMKQIQEEHGPVGEEKSG